MQNINYSEDFTLVINLRDVEDCPAALLDIDFDVRLKSGSMEYWAGRVRGELRNCRLEGAGDVLVVVCNNHRLPPCKELVADITYHLPDGNYADGVHDVTRRYRTGVCLTASECDMPSRAEFSALLPYIKGDLPEVVDYITIETDVGVYKIPILGYKAFKEGNSYSYGYYYDGGFDFWGIWDIDALNEDIEFADNQNEETDDTTFFLDSTIAE